MTFTEYVLITSRAKFAIEITFWLKTGRKHSRNRLHIRHQSKFILKIQRNP